MSAPAPLLRHVAEVDRPALARAWRVLADLLEEVEREQARQAALQRSVRAASEALDLVCPLYRTGLTNFQNVLDTQRSLTRQQDLLATSRGQVNLNLILIYRSLGGGWDRS